MPYVIAQPCVDVKDKACVDECPVDCIYEGSRSLYINPNECVDCGACETNRMAMNKRESPCWSFPRRPPAGRGVSPGEGTVLYESGRRTRRRPAE